MKARPVPVLSLLALVAPLLPARADNACRTVEVRFLPQGLAATYDPKTMNTKIGREALSPQIAVWVEDRDGKYVDTLFVTRVTGLLGLGNRSGQDFLKSDFRWPYGKRPMVLPVWAHRRNHSYPLVVMGGACSPKCGGDAHNHAADPDDEDTVAYHGSVSSAEPFYCSPSGFRTQGVDAVSCASAFYSSKGFFAAGRTSLYPPRADLDGTQLGNDDHPDVARFAALNDLAAVSGATPESGRIVDPPVRWAVPRSAPDGDYVVRVEVNIEADYNPPWWQEGLSVHDKYSAWDAGYGKQYLGQPSIVYSVPFHLDSSLHEFRSADYEGYGDIRGQSGALHPPDMTIATANRSGADRLKLVGDSGGDYRVKVSTVPCGGDSETCHAPPAPQTIDLVERTDTTMKVRLQMPAQVQAGTVLQVRYREGRPITEESFNQAIPAPSLAMAGGAVMETTIKGLIPKTTYYVAARAQAACGATSMLKTTSTATDAAQFTTLSGCFIATAAYGSPMMRQVGVLRAFRDRHLLTTPIGQALTASYYALSPPLAQAIAGQELVRGLVRRALAPVVSLARAIGP